MLPVFVFAHNGWEGEMTCAIRVNFRFCKRKQLFVFAKFTSQYNLLAMASKNMISDIDEIITKLREFNEERDWDQFHNGKDLAVALSIEASELLEAFLWKSPEDASVDKVKEELADVLNYAFQMADKYQLDIKRIMLDKLAKNAAKYPVEKARGSAKKYNEL